MRKKYWKVHKNDIHFFIKLGANSNQIKTWNYTCKGHDNYIYINECDRQTIKYSYMPYEEESIKSTGFSLLEIYSAINSIRHNFTQIQKTIQ